MMYSRFPHINFTPNNNHLEYSNHGKGYTRSHILPSEGREKGLLLFKHYGSLFGADSRGHWSEEVLPASLWIEWRRLYRYKESDNQTGESNREQQKENWSSRMTLQLQMELDVYDNVYRQFS